MDTATSLRHSTEQYGLYEPRVNLKLGFRACGKSGPRLNNELTGDVKNGGSLAILKKALKIHLLTKPYDFPHMRTEENLRCWYYCYNVERC